MAEQEVNLNEIKSQTVPTGTTAPIESDSPLFKPRPKIEKPANSSAADLVDLILNKSADDILPWEKTQLPSMGIFYDGRIPKGEIEVRPMGLSVDKILATQRLAQTGQALDYVFQKCVRFPDRTFDPLDLLPGDRTYLFYYLRGITHGNIYEFQINCPNEDCKTFNQYEYDLNLISKSIKRPKINKEPIRIILPYFSSIIGSDFWVDVRLLRQRDIKTIGSKKKVIEKITGGEISDAKGRSIKKRSTQEDLDQSIEENLNLVIMSVMGVSDRMKIQGIIQRMHASDTSLIRETLEDASPGIDTSIKIKCSECGIEMAIDLPITESFFHPKNGNRMRE